MYVECKCIMHTHEWIYHSTEVRTTSTYSYSVVMVHFCCDGTLIHGFYSTLAEKLFFYFPQNLDRVSHGMRSLNVHIYMYIFWSYLLHIEICWSFDIWHLKRNSNCSNEFGSDCEQLLRLLANVNVIRDLTFTIFGNMILLRRIL